MRDSAVETYKHRGCTIKVERDDDAENPRQWGTPSKMVCWHRRYELGDEQPKIDPAEFWRDLASNHCEDIDNLSKDEIDALVHAYYVILPLYLYDHSGITMNTTGFSCGWDSGRVGYIYISLKQARESEFPKLKAAKDETELRKAVAEWLVGEVETYDQYLTGEVYSWTAEDWDGENISSCCGYFGSEETKEGSYMVREAKAAIDYYIDKECHKQMDQPGEVDQLEFQLTTK